MYRQILIPIENREWGGGGWFEETLICSTCIVGNSRSVSLSLTFRSALNIWINSNLSSIRDIETDDTVFENACILLWLINHGVMRRFFLHLHVLPCKHLTPFLVFILPPGSWFAALSICIFQSMTKNKTKFKYI